MNGPDDTPAAALSKLRVGRPDTEMRTVPPELMAEAAERLGWLGLLYAASAVAAHFGRRAFMSLAGYGHSGFGAQDLFGLLCVAMGVVVFLIARRSLLSPKRLLDAGLVFQVTGAFGLAIVQFWRGLPPQFGSSFTAIPAECVWIIVVPLVVPNTPGKVLFSSLVAATMGPLAVFVANQARGVALDNPMAIAVYFLYSNYLCALIAYPLARIVHRYGVRLRHAREIGSYELTELLGEGGMGEVWKARHRLLARPAAIKLIRADFMGSNPRSRDAVMQRFEREAQDTATLGSTHTIDVYDFGVTEEGNFYYVMELLNGMSLERYIRTHGPMEPSRVAYLLEQVCHSLGEAHARGLVHRDIKPGNIFMCRLGPDDDFIKVLDFGLVKHFEEPAATTLASVGGTTAGTPAYMAPEIALGNNNIDGRADLYSLGCVAYWLLTGQQVFVRDTALATAVAHVKDEPVPPNQRSEFLIPDALNALVMDCLAKDPAARPANAAILAARLAASITESPWTPERAHTWWELHRVSTVDRAPEPAVAGAADTDPVVAGARPRCWPRFDRRPGGGNRLPIPTTASSD